MAEKERFELSRRLYPTYTLSRGASSANLSTSPYANRRFSSSPYYYTPFSPLCQYLFFSFFVFSLFIRSFYAFLLVFYRISLSIFPCRFALLTLKHSIKGSHRAKSDLSAYLLKRFIAFKHKSARLVYPYRIYVIVKAYSESFVYHVRNIEFAYMQFPHTLQPCFSTQICRRLWDIRVQEYRRHGQKTRSRSSEKDCVCIRAYDQQCRNSESQETG